MGSLSHETALALVPPLDRIPTLLEQALGPGGVRPLYQPIFDLTGEVPRLCAAECLSRGPVGTNIEAADLLFAYARHMRAEAHLDRTAIEAALTGVGPLDSLGLHLNVNASTLARDTSFPAFLEAMANACGFQPPQLTVEIVEQTAIVDRATFLASLDQLRERGFVIGLDDVGLGCSNFLMFYLTRPQVLKADRFFVHGVHEDPLRRAVLVAILELAQELGARVVAEGVEQEADLATLKELGVCEAQGYLLSRPLTSAQFRALVDPTSAPA